ncbi:MAG: sulfite exporter TauE/SafE family protein [Phycisphaerales bacterium JB063]
MFALIAAVFVASVLGSLHCAGMCGAFVVFAVGGIDAPRGTRLRLHAAYNGGRLVTYVLLGVVAGSIGAVLNLGGALAGLSRVATVLAGALMIGFGAVALMHAMGKSSMRWPVPPVMQRAMIAGQKFAMTLSPTRRALVIGLLTTLLPCGWLYAFAITAAGTASPLWGGVTMAAFWLGTLPVLVSLGSCVQQLTGALGARLPAMTALAVIVVGLWTLVGRAGLDASSILQAQAQAATSAQTEHGPTPTTHTEAATQRVESLVDQTPACCLEDEH